MSPNRICGIAALFGATAVLLGAFAAHGLSQKLEPRMLEVFHTGVSYQFYHTLALFGVGILAQRQSDRRLGIAAFCFILGMLLFSGSLYALALTGIRPLGIITPFGGVAMVIGWLVLAVTQFRGKRNDADNR